MFNKSQMQKQGYTLAHKPFDHSFRVDRRGIGIVKSLGPGNAKTFNEKVIKAFEALETIIDDFKEDFVDLRDDYATFKAEGPISGDLQTRAAPIDPELENTITEDHEQIKQMLTDAITDREQLDYVNKAVDKITEEQQTINNALTKLNADMNVYRVELKKGSIKGVNAEAVTKLKEEMSKVTTDVTGRVDKIVHAITNDLGTRVVQLKEDLAKLDKAVDARVTTKVGAYAMTIDKLQKEVKKLTADIDHKLGIKLTLVDDKVAEVDTKISNIDGKIATFETNLSKLTTQVDEKVTSQFNSTVNEVATQVTDVRADVQTKVAAVTNKVEEAIRDVTVNVDNQINTVKHEIDRSVQSVQSSIDTKVANVTTKVEEVTNAVQGRLDNVQSEVTSVQSNLQKVREELQKTVEEVVNQSKEGSANVETQLTTVHNELIAEINFIKDDLRNNTQSDIGLRHVVDKLVTDVAGIQTELTSNNNNDEETKLAVKEIREQLTELGVSLNSQLDDTDGRLRTVSNTVRENMNTLDDHQRQIETNKESIYLINGQLQRFEDDTANFKDDVDGAVTTVTNALMDHITFKPHPLDVMISDHQTKRHIGVPVDDIADYHLGQLVYFTVECYLFDPNARTFTNINEIEEPYADALNKQMIVYPSLATSGLWKELAGVVTHIDKELGVIQFASEGLYLVSDINDTASFGLGETIFFDPEKGIRIVADNATVTTKMRRLILGTVVAIVDKHTVQVLK